MNKRYRSQKNSEGNPWCILEFNYRTVFWLSGGSRRYPAGPRRAACQHENPGPECQLEAPKLCQQSNPQEAETAGV